MHSRTAVSPNLPTTSTNPSPQPENVEERIRQRAYELYLERGGMAGYADSDWLRAEEEILGNLRSQPAAA